MPSSPRGRRSFSVAIVNSKSLARRYRCPSETGSCCKSFNNLNLTRRRRCDLKHGDLTWATYLIDFYSSESPLTDIILSTSHQVSRFQRQDCDGGLFIFRKLETTPHVSFLSYCRGPYTPYKDYSTPYLYHSSSYPWMDNSITPKLLLYTMYYCITDPAIHLPPASFIFRSFSPINDALPSIITALILTTVIMVGGSRSD